jgi:hypothetical protein
LDNGLFGDEGRRRVGQRLRRETEMGTGGQGDRGTGVQGTEGQGDRGTGEQGDKGQGNKRTGGQGDKGDSGSQIERARTPANCLQVYLIDFSHPGFHQGSNSRHFRGIASAVALVSLGSSPKITDILSPPALHGWLSVKTTFSNDPPNEKFILDAEGTCDYRGRYSIYSSRVLQLWAYPRKAIYLANEAVGSKALLIDEAVNTDFSFPATLPIVERKFHEQSWTNGRWLSPLNISLGHVSGSGTETYNKVIGAVRDVARAVGTTANSYTVGRLIRERLFQQIPVNDPSVIPYIDVAVGAWNIFNWDKLTGHTLSINYRIVRQKPVIVTAADWEEIADTKRFNFPLVIETSFSFTITNNPSELYVQFGTASDLTLTNWVVPFQNGMISGIQKESSLKFKLGLPGAGNMLMTYTVSYNSHDLTLRVNMPTLQKEGQDQKVLVTFEGVDQQNFMLAGNVLYSLANNVFHYLPRSIGGPLQVAFPFLAESVNLNGPRDAYFTTLATWLGIPSVATPRITGTSRFCTTDYPSGLLLNITYNNGPLFGCTLRTNKEANMVLLANSFSKQLQACGLPVYVLGEKGSTATCGTIGIFPQLPGLIRSLSIDVSDKITPAFFQRPKVRFEMPVTPIFGSWKDLSWALFMLMNQPTYSPPLATTIPVADISVIPLALRKVYPSAIPVLSFPIEVRHQNTIPLTMSNSLVLSNGTLSATLAAPKGTAATDNYIKLDFFAALTGYPGYTNSLDLFTKFPSKDASTTVRITSPNNTFTLSLTYQKRWADGRTEILPTLKKSITLPVGSTYRDALSSTLTSLFPELRGALTVGVEPANPAIPTSYPQVAIRFARFKLPGDPESWIIPWSAGITESRLPYLSNFTLNAPRGSLGVRNLILTSKAVATPKVTSINGTIGVVEFSSKSVTGSLSMQTSVVTKRPINFATSLGLAVTDRKNYFASLNAKFDINSYLDIAGVTFGQFPSASSSIPADSRKFRIQTVTSPTLATTDQMDGLWSIFEPVIAKNTPRSMMESLSLLRTSHLCSLVNEVAALGDQAKKTGAVWEPLPFASSAFGDIYTNYIGDNLESVRSKVCDSDMEFSLRELCESARLTFGTTFCGSMSLATTGITFNTDLRMTKKPEAYFELNVNTFYPGQAASLPIASSDEELGMTSPLALQTSFRVDFAVPKPSFVMQPGSLLSVGSRVNYLGSSTAFFGSYRVTFQDQTIKIGSTSTMTSTYGADKKIAIAISGTAAMKGAVELNAILCMLDISVTDLGKFLKGSFTAPVVRVTDDCGVGYGFIDSLEYALQSNSLFNFFSDPALFTIPMVGEIENFLGVVFRPGGAVVGSLDVPLVGSLVQTQFMEKLLATFGTKFVKNYAKGITGFTRGFVPDTSMNSTQVDKALLEGFTRILCSVLPVVSCPPTPPVLVDGRSALSYSWPIKIQKKVSVPVTRVRYALAQGLDALWDVPKTNLEIDYTIAFTIVISTKKGTMVQWDIASPLAMTAALNFPKSTTLSGRLGWVGAKVVTERAGGLSMSLSLSTAMKPKYTQNTNIYGPLLLGLAGWGVTYTPETFQIVPTYTGFVETSWSDAVVPHPLRPPMMEFKSLRICYTSLLSYLANGFTQYVKFAMDFLTVLLGPEGFFVTKLAGTDVIFGEEKTGAELLEFLFDYFCSEGCVFKNVYEGITLWRNLIGNLRKLTALMSEDPTGCRSVLLIQDFKVDWGSNGTLTNTGPKIENPKVPYLNTDYRFTTEGKLKPLELPTKPPKGPPPPPPPPPPPAPPAPPSPPGTVSEPELELSLSLSLGGINVYITNDLRENFMKLIKGEDFPLIGWEMPALSVGVSVEIGILLYSPPEVNLKIGFGSTISIDPGEILITSKGIADSLKSENSAAFYNAIALRIVNDDGSPHIFLTWEFMISVGVELSIAEIFSIQVSISFTVAFDFSFNSINKADWVTFTELEWQLALNDYNPFAIISIDVRLSIGIEFKVTLKFDWADDYVIFKVEQSWEVYSKRIFSGIMPPPIADEIGVVNLGAIAYLDRAFSGEPLVAIYDYMGDRTYEYTRGRSPTLSRTITPDEGEPLTMKGDIKGKLFTLDIAAVQQQVIVPAAAAKVAKIILHQDSWTDAEFGISTSGIANTVAGGVLANACRSLSLPDAQAGSLVAINGLPCPTSISSIYGNVTITGSPRDYLNKPLVFTGSLLSTYVSVTSESFTFNNNKVCSERGNNRI